MKFSIKDFFSECDQIRSFLRIWSYLLKKSLMENFISCAVILENNLNLTRTCIEKYGRYIEWKFAEVVSCKCLSKQLFCKYETNLKENTHAEVRFQ